MAAMEADAASSDSSPRVVDVSGQSLTHISQISGSGSGKNVAALIADGNHFSTLRGINRYPSLIQLSVRSNSLVKMESISPLLHLVTLNLQSNSITDIAGLEKLSNLQWLCLAGNSISEMSGLTSNKLLSHLDLSDNCICELGDISMLTQLKTLLLHGNGVSEIQSVPHCLPPSLNTLSLAENDVSDLNQMSYLSALSSLTQLSVMGNPCLTLSDPHRLLDYRTFILYWCRAVSTLDGIVVTLEERQRSQTLFPTGQLYPFSLGQHEDLVSYLTSHVAERRVVNSAGMEPDTKGRDPSHIPSLPSLGQLQSVGPQQSEQADVLRKLKTLQIVQQMIAIQEQLLQQQDEEEGGDSHGGTSVLPSDEPEGRYSPAKQTMAVAATAWESKEVGALGGWTDSSLLSQQDKGGEEAFNTNKDSAVAPSPSTTITTQTYSRATPSISEWKPPQGSSLDLEQSLPSELGSMHSGWLGTIPPGTFAEQLAEVSQLQGSTVLTKQAGTDGVMSHHFSAPQQSSQLPVSEYVGLTDMEPNQPSSNTASGKPDLLHAEETVTVPSEFSSGRSSPCVLDLLPSTTTVSPVASARTDGGGAEWNPQFMDSSSLLGSSKPSETQTVELPQDIRLTSSLLEQRQKRLRLLNEKIAQLRLQQQQQQWPPHSLPPTQSMPPFHTTVLTSASRDESSATLTMARSGTMRSSQPTRVADISQRVAPTDYRLPGVPSYVSTSPVSTDAEKTVSTGVAIRPSSPPISDGGSQQLLSGGNHVTSDYFPHESDPDLLDSSSRYLPVASPVPAPGPEPDSIPTHGTIQELDPIPIPDDGTSLGLTAEQDLSTLATSLLQAYGLTGVTDTTTQLFASLINTRGGSAIEDNDPIIGRALSESNINSVSADTEPLRPKLSKQLAAVRIQAALRGYLVRKHLASYVQQHRAAVVIQAAWRGYHARRHDPVVEAVRRELRRRKLETLATTLYLQLLGCRQELAHQAHVVQIQDETIQSLMLEVDVFSRWKARVEFERESKAATMIQKYWRGYIARKECGYSGSRLRSSSAALWSMCSSLKEQVQQLEAIVVSMLESTYVYGETRQRFQRMGFIGSAECSTSEKPFDSESQSLQGDLPPPTALQMSHHSDSCLLLQWTPPTQQVAPPTQMTPTPAVISTSAGPTPQLLGIRIYVNGSSRGIVGAAKSKAYIEGLDQSTTYRITVRAVYTAGESKDSNPVVALLTLPHQRKAGGDGSSDSQVDSKSAMTLPDSRPPERPQTLEPVITGGGGSDSEAGSGWTKPEALDKSTGASTDNPPMGEVGSQSRQHLNATIEKPERTSVAKASVHPPEEQQHDQMSSLTQLPVYERWKESGDQLDTPPITNTGIDETLKATSEANPLANASSERGDTSKVCLEKSDASDVINEDDTREERSNIGSETGGLIDQVSAVGDLPLNATTQEAMTSSEPKSGQFTLAGLTQTSGGIATTVEMWTSLDATLTDVVDAKNDSALQDNAAQLQSITGTALQASCTQNIANQAATSISAATLTAGKTTEQKLGSIKAVFSSEGETELIEQDDDQKPQDFDALPGNPRTEGMPRRRVGSNPSKQGDHTAQLDTTGGVSRLPEGKQCRIIVGNEIEVNDGSEPHRESNVGSGDNGDTQSSDTLASVLLSQLETNLSTPPQAHGRKEQQDSQSGSD